MNPFRTIKGKLISFALCLSLVPVIIITVVSFINSKYVVKEQSLEWISMVAISAKAHTREFIETRKMGTQHFGSDGFIRDCLEKFNRDGPSPYNADVLKSLSAHLINNKMPLDKWLEEIAVIDINGRIVAATAEEMIGSDFSNNELFIEGLKGTYVGGQCRTCHLPKGKKCIPISTPITSRLTGETMGVLVNITDLFALSEVTTLARTGKTLEVYIVDNEGIMLTESRFLDDAPTTLRVDTEPVRKIHEIVSGFAPFPDDLWERPFMTGIYDDYRGVPIIGSAIYFPEYDWTLLAEIDYAEILIIPFKILSTVAVTSGCVVGAIAAIIGIIFAISVSRPIKRLTDATDKFGGGDLGHRINLNRKDEIGVLANGFNTMAGELQALTQNLEQHVAERTKDLARTNEELQRGIIERKRAEVKIQLTAEKLARSNVELQQFAYIASHDLQEPLRMVASYTQLLGRRYKGKLDSDADDFISYAVDGAQRLQNLINDLLSYSRVETRGKPFEITNTSECFLMTTTNLKLAIEETGAEVTHDDLPTVIADTTQIVQLFQNLIGNAIKFRSKEAPRVHASAEHKGDEWVFTVRDNGIGIDPQHHDRIFVIFQRLHGRNEFPGTGIGLAICRRIVERRGGRIWVESEPGKGTTFYFTIPYTARGDVQ